MTQVLSLPHILEKLKIMQLKVIRRLLYFIKFSWGIWGFSLGIWFNSMLDLFAVEIDWFNWFFPFFLLFQQWCILAGETLKLVLVIFQLLFKVENSLIELIITKILFFHFLLEKLKPTEDSLTIPCFLHVLIQINYDLNYYWTAFMPNQTSSSAKP